MSGSPEARKALARAGGEARMPMKANGFSLVEVMVALIILSVGVLGMAGTTGYLSTRVKRASLDTERAAAVQLVAERLRSIAFDKIEPKTRNQAEQVGRMLVWWDVVGGSTSGKLRRIEVYTCGPECLASGGQAAQADVSYVEIYQR